MDKLNKLMKKASLYNGLRLCLGIIILLYMLTYILAFCEFNSVVGSYLEQADFEDGMTATVAVFGKTFIIALIMFGLSKIKHKVIPCFLIIIISVLHILYLGVPGSEEFVLFGDYEAYVSVNVAGRLTELRDLANHVGDDLSAFHCQMGVVLIYIIEVLTIVAMILALATIIASLVKECKILSKRLKGQEIEEIKKCEKVKLKKHEVGIRVVNILIAVFCILYTLIFGVEEVWNYSNVSLKEMIEQGMLEFDLSFFIYMGLPFALFVIIVVDTFVAKKHYIITIIWYILYMIAMHGGMYWFYGWADDYNDTNVMRNLHNYFSFVILGICVMIAGIVWKLGRKFGNKLAGEVKEVDAK